MPLEIELDDIGRSRKSPFPDRWADSRTAICSKDGRSRIERVGSDPMLGDRMADALRPIFEQGPPYKITPH